MKEFAERLKTALMGRELLKEGMKEYGCADLQDTAEQTGNISSNCGWRQEPGRMSAVTSHFTLMLMSYPRGAKQNLTLLIHSTPSKLNLSWVLVLCKKNHNSL